MAFFIFISLFFPSFATFAGQDPLDPKGLCQEWFRGIKVNPGIFCVYDCTLAETTKETDTCILSCPTLCERNYAGVAAFRLADLYPGLSKSERALVVDAPFDSMRTYALSWKAENICVWKYMRSLSGDESDACRHYMWAGLLTQNMGEALAQKFLNAHEDEPMQPIDQKSMDLANNRAGILACNRLRATQACNEKKLLEEFLSDLKNRALVVLKPRKTELIK